jgi:hypothetical protein
MTNCPSYTRNGILSQRSNERKKVSGPVPTPFSFPLVLVERTGGQAASGTRRNTKASEMQI